MMRAVHDTLYIDYEIFIFQNLKLQTSFGIMFFSVAIKIIIKHDFSVIINIRVHQILIFADIKRKLENIFK